MTQVEKERAFILECGKLNGSGWMSVKFDIVNLYAVFEKIGCPVTAIIGVKPPFLINSGAH
jgi:hypothetical protein